MKVREGSLKVIKQDDGAEAYLHLLDKFSSSDVIVPVTPPSERSAPEIVNAVYELLLQKLTMPPDSQWRADLKRRGLTDLQIDKRQYREYLGGQKPWSVTKSLYEKFGHAIFGVPGIIAKQGENGPYPSMMGMPKSKSNGLLVPIRDRYGQIVAMKIRMDTSAPGDDEEGKYLFLSSHRDDWPGPKADALALHFPLGINLDGQAEIRAAEGPLKADIATDLSGFPSVGIQNRSAWRPVIDLLEEFPDIKRVRVALDGDFRTNKDVARDLVGFINAIEMVGREPLLETWDESQAKGIDDALAANLPIRLLNGADSRAEAAAACKRLGVAPNRKIVYQASFDQAEPAVCDYSQPLSSIENTSNKFRTANDANKKINDPSGLARKFLQSRFEMAEDNDRTITLRSYNGTFYEWKNGAYGEVNDKTIESAVWKFCENVFDAANREDARVAAEKGKEPPEALSVTITTQRNVLAALHSFCHVQSSSPPPFWIEGEPLVADLDRCLFAKNGIVYLTDFIADKPNYLINPTPRLFNTSALPFDFDAHAPAPSKWLAFLKDVWPDDQSSIDVLQQWFGYCITPRTDLQKMLWIVGPRRSGKGTISRILSELIGEKNTCGFQLKDLSERFGLSNFIGKSLAIAGEGNLSGRADAVDITERLKSITGEDIQSIDRKGKDIINAVIKARLVILMNALPKLKDASAAITTRVVLVNTKITHIDDADIALGGRIKEGLPGILLWAIDGWKKLADGRGFQQPESGKKSIDSLTYLACPVRQFFDECCVIDNDAPPLPKQRLFDTWVAWSKARNIQIGSSPVFFKDLGVAVCGLEDSRPTIDGKRVWCLNVAITDEPKSFIPVELKPCVAWLSSLLAGGPKELYKVIEQGERQRFDKDIVFKAIAAGEFDQTDEKPKLVLLRHQQGHDHAIPA